MDSFKYPRLEVKLAGGLTMVLSKQPFNTLPVQLSLINTAAFVNTITKEYSIKLYYLPLPCVLTSVPFTELNHPKQLVLGSFRTRCTM